MGRERLPGNSAAMLKAAVNRKKGAKTER